MSDDKLKSLIDLYSSIKKSDETAIKSMPSIDVAKLLSSREASDKYNLSKEEKFELLKMRYAVFLEKNEFCVGGLVKWKAGLINKAGLGYDDIAIVVNVLDEPIFDDDKDSGSPYFKEPLDLVIAFLDADNDFITLHVDSRRVRPVPSSPNKSSIQG